MRVTVHWLSSDLGDRFKAVTCLSLLCRSQFVCVHVCEDKKKYLWQNNWSPFAAEKQTKTYRNQNCVIIVSHKIVTKPKKIANIDIFSLKGNQYQEI